MGKGGRGRWAGKGPAFHGRGEEGRHSPVRSDTLPNPLDTPPSDPRPEERVQPKQTAETHRLCASGGAAPRRAWYGGRAGSCPGQSRGAGGGGEQPRSRSRGQGALVRAARGTGAVGERPPRIHTLLSFAPLSSPAVKFDCFPGACKNNLLRSLVSCLCSWPGPSHPSSENLE